MTGPVPNLSPSPGRVGRVCVCVWHEERVLLVEHEGLFTFPGGGVDPGEGFEQAAVREAWEEAGARVRLKGLLWENAGREGPERCYLAELEALEPSPEGRAAVWVNPHALPWSEDRQIGPVLRALGLHRERLSLAVPERVRQALELARQHGFDRSCSLEVGRLLRQLAARPELRIAELGTGVGVGAAWMASGMGAGSSLLTVELDPARAALAQGLFAPDPRVRVLQGDWQQALGSGPFDLIFSDCNPAKRETAHLPALVACLTPGGTLLVDNFSPPHLLPPALRAGGDLEREALFDHPDLWALELPVSRHEHVILATRKG